MTIDVAAAGETILTTWKSDQRSRNAREDISEYTATTTMKKTEEERKMKSEE